MAISRGWGELVMGSYSLVRPELLFGMTRKFWKLITAVVNLTNATVRLKIVKKVNFMLCVFLL